MTEEHSTHTNMGSHAGRELDLMLKQTKPLAMFYDDADAGEDESVIPEQSFDPFVKEGLFCKGARTFELSNDPRKNRRHRVRYVLYALANEQWRIPAMFFALEAMFEMGRADEGIDRVVGRLLGYSSDEINSYVRIKQK